MAAYSTLGALEAAQDEATSAARRRIEEAEEHLSFYRSETTKMLEAFYAVADSQGLTYHPDFRSKFQKVVDSTDENVRAATDVILEFDEELRTMTAVQADERDEFLAQRSENTAR
ncbi:hypothetical protein AB4Z18_03260 [Leifsonia sp. 2TAF2]|uniref:hypothetical protein n=1 Tax=Leifsonia sp. 2TAF2 TaxID=3233009 RepID=UPI003F9DAEE8